MTQRRASRFSKEALYSPAARLVARWGISANQVTWASVALMTAAAAAYVVHRSLIIFATCVVLFELLDDLDGAVARVTGTTSHEGAFLDAMTDRYKDCAVLAALGFVHSTWPAAFFALSGGFLTSYAKARAGMQVPIKNDAWPDGFERMERIVFIVVLLVTAAAIPPSWASKDQVITWGLLLLGTLTNATALRRVVRALRLLRQHAALDPAQAPLASSSTTRNASIDPAP